MLTRFSITREMRIHTFWIQVIRQIRRQISPQVEIKVLIEIAHNPRSQIYHLVDEQVREPLELEMRERFDAY